MNAQNPNQIVIASGTQLPQNMLSGVIPQGNNQYPQYSPIHNKVENIDLGDYFRTLMRHKLLLLSSVTALSLLALLYTLSITPTYRASTTLQIDQTTHSIVNYNVLQESRQHALDKHFYQTQYDILKSRKLASRVIEQLNLAEYDANNTLKKPIVSQYIEKIKAGIRSVIPTAQTEDKSDTTENSDIKVNEIEDTSLIDPSLQLANKPIELSFLSRLTITPSEKSNIVEVFYESTEPEMAAKIVNAIAENYINLNLEAKGNSSEYAKKFIAEQLTISKKNLEESEQELVDYAKNNQIINTDDNNSIISSELQTLSTAYIDAKKELIFAESAYRKKHKISGTIRLLDNGVILALKESKATLDAKYSELSQVYKPQYPKMLQLKSEIRTLEQQINKETAEIRQASSTNLQADFLAAQQNSRALRSQLDAKKYEILSLRDKNVGYKVLERETTTNREIYNGLLQRMREIDIASGAVDNNIFVIDAGFVPYKKYKPNTARNLFAGGLLGLFLGIVLSFFKENNSDTVNSHQELIEITNLPIIGLFPLTRNRKRALLIHRKHDLAVEEAFRSIAVDLGFSSEEGIPKILHITSAESGEGKSSTAINIATTMANEGSKVVLIDADLRRSKLHKYLNISNENGFSELLEGKATFSEAIQTSETTPNLSIITAGASVDNPVKLLASNSLLKTILELTKHFDQIVIDSPPVLGMADALILANRSHGTLFLTSNNQSKKANISDALNRLNRSYTNIIGLIVTKEPMGNNNYFSYKP